MSGNKIFSVMVIVLLLIILGSIWAMSMLNSLGES
jgi:heme/copper-type cytochrome/quinol oxidase subunit 4